MAAETGLIRPIVVASELLAYCRGSVGGSYTPIEANPAQRLPALQDVNPPQKLASQLDALRRPL